MLYTTCTVAAVMLNTKKKSITFFNKDSLYSEYERGLMHDISIQGKWLF